MKDLIYGYFTATHKTVNYRRKSGYDIDTGYVCVLVKRPPLGSDSTEYEASFGFCSPNDQFVKRIGRSIANGRMTAGKTLKFSFVKSETNPKPIFEHAMTLALSLNGKEDPGVMVRALETPFSYDLIMLSELGGKRNFSPRWLLASSLEYGINREKEVVGFVKYGEAEIKATA